MSTQEGPYLLRDLVDHFMSWAEKNRAPRTADFYRTYLDRFILHCENISVLEVKAHHLLTFTSSWHPMQAVQRCFAWAADEAELIARNPFKRIKRPALGQRSRILAAIERARLLRRSTQKFRQVLIALRETIARPQEVREMEWNQVQVHGEPAELLAALVAGRAAFHLAEFKGRKRRKDTTAERVIPITPRLGRLLARMARAAGYQAGPIFTNQRGLPWTRNALRLRMRKARDLAGLGADRRGERVVCYTFRHTGATEACALGVRDRVLADLMGHSNPRMTARYQHLSADHLLAAMAELTAKRISRGKPARGAA